MTNMKNMKLINLIFAISLLALSQAALASMKITVNGMVCSFCAQGIEKNILKLDETKAVLVDLKNKVVIVEAKEGKTLNEKLIKEEITDSGYDVVSIETISQTVAQFKEQMKGKK
jgi:copper chaperone CopZ